MGTVLLVALLALAGCQGLGPQDAAASSRIHVYVQEAPDGTGDIEYEGDVVHPGAPFTALDQLTLFSNLEGFDVDTTYYPSFDATVVDSIAGLEGQAGPEGTFYYWKLLVNGFASETGADQKVIQDGDSVEWVYVLE